MPKDGVVPGDGTVFRGGTVSGHGVVPGAGAVSGGGAASGVAVHAAHAVRTWLAGERFAPSRLVLVPRGALTTAAGEDVEDPAAAAVWSLVEPGPGAMVAAGPGPVRWWPRLPARCGRWPVGAGGAGYGGPQTPSRPPVSRASGRRRRAARCRRTTTVAPAAAAPAPAAAVSTLRPFTAIQTVPAAEAAFLGA